RNSYAPNDGVPRHPDQYYELFGDLIIATILLRLRSRLPEGTLFLTYLLLFSVLRFFLFFVRGNVPVVAFGLKGIAGSMEGHAEMDMSLSGGSIWSRLTSPKGFTAISHYFLMDWAAVWRDVAGGLLIAGALA